MKIVIALTIATAASAQVWNPFSDINEQLDRSRLIRAQQSLIEAQTNRLKLETDILRGQREILSAEVFDSTLKNG